MRLRRLLLVTVSVVGLGVLGSMVLDTPRDSSWVARIAGATVAAVAGTWLVGRMAGARAEDASGLDVPDEFEAVWRRGTGHSFGPEPPERRRHQQSVRLAVGSADHAQRRLRPVLRDLADARFDAVFGTHPDRDPRAAERLGPAAWAWVRPDRPEPPDRHGPGPRLDELDRVVTAIEALGNPYDQDESPP